MPEVKLPEGFVPPSAAVVTPPKLNRIEVRRDDLACALKYMTVDGGYTQAVKDRLTAALLQYDGSTATNGGGSASD